MSEFWTDRRVFVTGAGGLVGGHLVGELLNRGADVVALVRDHEPRSMLLSDIDDFFTIAQGDVSDLALMRRIIGEYEIDTVFHLAAQTIVGIAERDPWSTWESNVRGTYSLMEAVRLHPRVRRVIAASTDKVYGEASLPTPETAPLLAEFPYEVSKACGDMICRSYHDTYGTPVVLTRCGNLFGEGDLNWNRIVPGAIRSCLRGDFVEIRSDGTLIRDYLYVGDAVSAYLALAEADEAVHGQAYNITESRPMSVREIVWKVQDAVLRANPTLNPYRTRILGRPVKEIPQQFLDGSKMRALGWSPAFGLEAGLDRTVNWYMMSL